MKKYLAPALFIMLWSTGFLGAKYAMPHASAFTFLSIRALLTLIVLILAFFIIYGKISTKGISVEMLNGALIHGGYLGGVFFAVSHGFPAGLSAVIVGAQPIVTAVLAAIFLKEQIDNSAWFWLFIGFVGVTLVILGQEIDIANGNVIGVIACLIALFSISIGTMLQKKSQAYLAPVDPHNTRVIWQYFGALFVFLLGVMFLETPRFVPHIEAILALLWLVFGLSVAAILILSRLIEGNEMKKVASYFYLVPVLVLVETYFIFGETISMLSGVGALLTIVSVIYVNKKR